MASAQPSLSEIQAQVQTASIPLSIRLSPSESRTYEDTDPYLVRKLSRARAGYPLILWLAPQIHVARLSYLPSLLPRLLPFFTPFLITPPTGPTSDDLSEETEKDAQDESEEPGWFSSDSVPLKWHFPIGLLYDLFSGVEPFNAQDRRGRPADESEISSTAWEITVHFSDFPSGQLVRLDKAGRVWEDSWVNGVKEADFIRTGTGRGIMSLSEKESRGLWEAVKTHDIEGFNKINERLMSPPDGKRLRHLPLRFYLPTPTPTSTSDTDREIAGAGAGAGAGAAESRGEVRILQPLIPPILPHREPNTLGVVLHDILPSLFPSRRIVTLARPVMHGADLPLSAPVEEIYRIGAGFDGWAGIVIVML